MRSSGHWLLCVSALRRDDGTRLPHGTLTSAWYNGRQAIEHEAVGSDPANVRLWALTHELEAMCSEAVGSDPRT